MIDFENGKLYYTYVTKKGSFLCCSQDNNKICIIHKLPRAKAKGINVPNHKRPAQKLRKLVDRIGMSTSTC